MISPRGLLGVAIRTIGIWHLTYAAYSAFWAVMKAKDAAIGSPSYTSDEHVQFAIFYTLVGVLLIWLADPIVWLLYGAPLKVAPPDDAGSNPSSPVTPDKEPPL
jgi:hypothetical protein